MCRLPRQFYREVVPPSFLEFSTDCFFSADLTIPSSLILLHLRIEWCKNKMTLTVTNRKWCWRTCNTFTFISHIHEVCTCPRLILFRYGGVLVSLIQCKCSWWINVKKLAIARSNLLFWHSFDGLVVAFEHQHGVPIQYPITKNLYMQVTNVANKKI